MNLFRISHFDLYYLYSNSKQDNSSKKMRKEMILRGLSEDETFSKICENEDVKRLMEKLSSEV